MTNAEIPSPKLKQLIDEAQKIIEARIDKIRVVEQFLCVTAGKFRKHATAGKLCIVVLGALVATRVVADNLFPPATGPGSIAEIEVPYTVLAVILAIIAGLQTAFKPGEIASELTFYPVRCDVVIREVEQEWYRRVARTIDSMERLENTDPLLIKLDALIDDVSARMAQLGLSPPASDGDK